MARKKVRRSVPAPKLNQPHVKARVDRVRDAVARHPGENAQSLAARVGYAIKTVREDLDFLRALGELEVQVDSYQLPTGETVVRDTTWRLRGAA